MEYNMKRIFCVILICAQVTVFVGCNKMQNNNLISNSNYSTKTSDNSAAIPSETRESTKSSTDAAESDDVSIIYGDWEITKVLALPRITEFNAEENAKKNIGKIISYSSCEARYGDEMLKNPEYKISLLSKDDFDVGYNIPYNQLGINEESIVRIEVYDGSYIWDGCNTIFIKDKETLILWSGECYEMKRVSNT